MIHFTSIHNFCSYLQNYVPFHKNKSKEALRVKNNTILDENGDIIGIYKPIQK